MTADVVDLYLQDAVEDEQERASLGDMQAKIASLEALLNTFLTEVRALKAMEQREVEAGGGVPVTVTARDENGNIKTLRIG